MNYLYSILSIIFVISLIFDYLSFYYKYSAIELVNDMGIGYNLGNTYNYSDDLGNESKENFEIKTWGTILPTKKAINKIKKIGFKTIRFQVKYMNYTNEIDIINSEWINKIKEIVKWIINSNMYCILSIYHDNNFWEIKGQNSKDKYINLWTQIANEFKDFNYHLVFESFYDFGFLCYSYYFGNCYIGEFFLSQIFVNIIRNSNGNNKERLLIIPGVSSEIELNNIFNDFYEMNFPKDPANKLAISLNLFFPGDVDINWDEYNENELIYLYDNLGLEYFFIPNYKWGRDNDYKNIINIFKILKRIFIDKDYPVVIGEIGIYNKHIEKNSIRQFLYTIFSISSEYEGILPCLWDISEKIEGDMNYYYNKGTNEWTDKIIGDNFLKISNGNFIKTSKYYFQNNAETDNLNIYGYIHIDVEFKKVKTIILNVKIIDINISKNEIPVSINTCYKNQEWYEIPCKNGRRQYDGSITFTIDATNMECYYFVEAISWWGAESVFLNYLTVIYEDNYHFLDYKSYKSAILKEISK